MASKMGVKNVVQTFLLLVGVFTSQAIDVNVIGEWKTDLGWEVTCGWQTLPNDTLQSVRLYNNGQQFMIFRPEKHGTSRSEVFRTPENFMNVDCTTTADRGQQGKCTLILEPYQPPVYDFTYTCEVSGERPMFRIGKKDFYVRVLVPPSDAVLHVKSPEDPTSPRVTLNCSSTGLPAPSLLWNVGGDKVQADFSKRDWNATSKLWQSWSTLSFTRSDLSSTATCLPEVKSNNETIKGKAAVYNSAESLCGILKLTVFTMMALHLLS
ncbi:uncharacterized protein LOC119832871 [Zerene cesonia]|uniref:uncharacterized protein LOC119832871 n=1 Tax=Zerene cesonia TaxID=33412 RepID=UPI0018E54D64|nr:uncharacterized protein LOC119832871 [Zerene cesonia]